MCLNFIPTHNRKWVEDHFSVSLPDVFRDEIYPGYYCPMIRSAFDSGQYRCQLAHFGLIPPWAKIEDLTKDTHNAKSELLTAHPVPDLHRETYNARSETVKTKPSFRAAWNHRHFALIAIDSYMQPNYETGSAVRWKVSKADGSPFALACLWERWVNVERGDDIISFCILTRDASTHPLLRRFHKPGDPKRMPIIISDAHLQAWLEAGLKQADDILSMDFSLDLVAEPFPRIMKSKQGKEIKSPVTSA